MRARKIAGRAVSALGFGGYRIGTSPQHRIALHAALDRGCTLVDTAPHYSDGASEALIGSVLAERAAPRPLVVTKVGILQGAELAAAAAREAAAAPWPGVVKLSAQAWLCLSPEYIAHSVAASTRRLGAPPDVVLLHNPEFVLADLLRRGEATTAATDAFYSQTLAHAFAALEEAPGLAAYGVSSNTVGCRWGVSGGPNGDEALCIDRTVAAAAAAAGGAAHRCRVLQLPLNLLEPDAAARGESGGATPVAATPAAQAQALGLSVMAHRPLHALPPPGAGGGFGAAGGGHLALRDGRPTLPAAALVRQQARHALGGAAAAWPLEELALRWCLAAPAVDVVLCGARRAEYAAQAFGLPGASGATGAGGAALPAGAFEDVADAMRTLMRDWEAEAAAAAAAAPPRAAAARAARAAQGLARAARGQARGLSGSAAPRGGRTHVDLRPGSDLQLKPSPDGGPLRAIGSADRGAGLVYRAGRLSAGAAAAVAAAGGARAPRPGRWAVKVQPPLDSSSDARGGIGRMTPTTLLLHDEARGFVAFVREEDDGHGALLRRALRAKGQVAFLHAEDTLDESGRPVVRVHVAEDGPGDLGW